MFKNVLLALIGKKAGKLKYPTLFFTMAGLFLVNLVIPDFIPFVDEILMALGTLFLGNMFKKEDSAEPVEASERSQSSNSDDSSESGPHQ